MVKVPERKLQLLCEVKLVLLHDAMPPMFRGIINQDVSDDRMEDAWKHAQPFLAAAKEHYCLEPHEFGDERVFASLVGPFIGYYMRVPRARDETEARMMLATCIHTKHIWCALYTLWEALESIEKWNRGERGLLRVSPLDYDYTELNTERRG